MTDDAARTAPRAAGDSLCEMTHLVMPSDANVMGTAFGGKIVEWTDLAASIASMRHARMPCVTASIDQLSFLAPVRIGHIAILRAQVNAVFSTSLEVGVEVLDEDPVTGARRKCCDALLTFVALGPDRRPARVPPLRTDTEAERRREREAGVRRQARLALRDALRGA